MEWVTLYAGLHLRQGHGHAGDLHTAKEVAWVAGTAVMVDTNANGAVGKADGVEHIEREYLVPEGVELLGYGPGAVKLLIKLDLYKGARGALTILGHKIAGIQDMHNKFHR